MPSLNRKSNIPYTGVNILGRTKIRASTLCRWTVDDSVILEGDILAYGDHYPCIVLYNPYEARFEAVEFGYPRRYRFVRIHELTYQATPWKVIGRYPEDRCLLRTRMKVFNYEKYLIRSGYEKHNA